MKENIKQLEVINSNDNLLVIASAGCGKTFCITEKIKRLLNTILPEEILVISFTNETVNDLKNKLDKNINILTFHKLALKILDDLKISYILLDDYYLNFIIDEFFICIINKEDKFNIKLYFGNFFYSNMLDNTAFLHFKKAVYTFIKHMKSKNLGIPFLESLYLSEDSGFLYRIIAQIFKLYEDEKKSQQMLDLDDLIIEASKHAFNNNFPYKYIFVDEFQDSSLIRFELVYNIFKSSNAKINFFGDDFQSIYAFSGCNLDIMLNIKDYIKDIKTISLDTNYRSDNKLINIANCFIMKNDKQIPKFVRSDICINDSFNLIYTTNTLRMFNKLAKDIPKDEIMVLGRYKSDLIPFSDYKCLTIHESKGLEANYVFIVNFSNDIYGFPSKVFDFDILDIFKPNETIKYAEERRLCYVAITRAKKKVFILIPFESKSVFTEELLSISSSIDT